MRQVLAILIVAAFVIGCVQFLMPQPTVAAAIDSNGADPKTKGKGLKAHCKKPIPPPQECPPCEFWWYNGMCNAFCKHIPGCKPTPLDRTDPYAGNGDGAIKDFTGRL